MSDLISRQAILKHIDKIRYGVQMMDDTHRASIIMNGMHLCEDAVRNQPSAERKGKWINKPNVYGVAYCSECDFELHINDTNFCPNCGADMRGEENDSRRSNQTAT